MRRDKRVFVIGEDVGVYGGAFKVTQGFQEEFGPWRVIDAPLSETAIVGGCTGAAIMGMRPVAEMQFADFVSCAWDHLVTVAAKQRYRAGTPVPIVVRLPSGGGFSGGPFHSQNPESSFAHIPGLKCVCPATPEDAKGLLIAAIEDPNPVLYFEHKHLYRRIKGEVPEERYTVPIGKARLHREGDDVSVITWGAMVYTAGGGRRAARGRRDLDGDRRPALGDAVGQGRGARERPQDVEGARAPRGHAHRRLRRRDRGDDRRGGVRGPRRAGAADHRARLPGAVLAGAGAGVHPAGRGRRHRRQGVGELLMATTVVDVVMPQMGVSVSEGTILKWLKQEGETIEADEPLLEISTDKVDTEVPSPGSGVVQQILVAEGETVDVGTRLAVIAPEGAEVEESRRPEPEPAAAGTAPSPRAAAPPPAPHSAAPHRRTAAPARGRSSLLSSRGSPAEHGVDVVAGARHRRRRPRDEEGHPRVRRVGPARCAAAGRGARGRRPPRLQRQRHRPARSAGARSRAAAPAPAPAAPAPPAPARGTGSQPLRHPRRPWQARPSSR